MTKLEGMTNDQMTKRGDVATSSFVLRVYFVIRYSGFVISSGQNAFECSGGESQPVARDHNTIVSPRVGPTLTMESFAPASSEMYLTYFLAAEGSCENLRAVCIDVFQPGTSS